MKELAEPSIKEEFGKCVQQGASRIIVSPYFLSPGRHWNKDIPSLASEASKEHSNVPYIITAPLGLHDLMVDIMNDRIKYCLRHVAGPLTRITEPAPGRLSSGAPELYISLMPFGTLTLALPSEALGSSRLLWHSNVSG
uniref:Uncharacterized protein n=1 Tax=Avena sativa TaxID=4498 RepID=A0ACD5UYZ1_AVESA